MLHAQSCCRVICYTLRVVVVCDKLRAQAAESATIIIETDDAKTSNLMAAKFFDVIF